MSPSRRAPEGSQPEPFGRPKPKQWPSYLFPSDSTPTPPRDSLALYQGHHTTLAESIEVFQETSADILRFSRPAQDRCGSTTHPNDSKKEETEMHPHNVSADFRIFSIDQLREPPTNSRRSFDP